MSFIKPRNSPRRGVVCGRRGFCRWPTSSAAKQRRVPCRVVVVALAGQGASPFGNPQNNLAPAPAPGSTAFSSTHRTSGFLGGAIIEPHDVGGLAANRGRPLSHPIWRATRSILWQRKNARRIARRHRQAPGPTAARPPRIALGAGPVQESQNALLLAINGFLARTRLCLRPSRP